MNACLNIAAIYAARSSRIRAGLPAERSRDFCASECYAKGDPTICDASTVCWAKSVGADGRVPILAQRRLQLERGWTPAPRPRRIAAVARDYYINHGGPR
jgi:hypothetical protein